MAPAAALATTHVSGTITQDTTWTVAGSPYVLGGTVTVNSGVTLTLNSGVAVKGLNSSSGLSIAGTLVADATVESPISFTSYKDDTVGGDTNGDGSATSPATGDWAGLYLASTGTATLDHATVRCAGGSSLWCYAAIRVMGGASSTIDHSTITYSYGDGISVASGGNLAVHNSNIVENLRYGVYAAPGSYANAHAENNWWGSASGPAPYGTGNGISYHYVYDEWGNRSTVIDVSADPWLGKALWDGPSLGRAGWCGYAADPVNVGTGNFTYDTTDLSISTRGLPLEVVRSYNSQLAQDSPFGWGWSFSYNLHVEEDCTLGGTDHYAAVTREDGGQLWYREKPDGSYEPPPGIFDTLVALPGGGWKLITKEQQAYLFDAAGRVISITDRNGNTTTISYGAYGISAIVAPDGRALDLVCGAGGHITSVTDPLSRSWSYSYDAAGNLASVTDPANHTTHYAYDGEHRLLTIVDANGHTVVANTYDADGRVIHQLDARGNPTNYTYDLGTNKTYVRNALGKTTIYVSNTAHCLASVTSPRGGTTHYSYDANNNKTEAVDPLGRITTFTYDARGNLLTTTNAYEDTASTTYDENNNPLTKTDFAGHTWHYTYDGHGNLTESKDPLDHITTNTYDAHGQLESSTDARNKTTTFEHNAHGDLTKTTLPSGAQTTFTHDAAGRTISQKNALNKTWTYDYDALDRPTKTTDPLGHFVSVTYDAVGNKLTSKDARGHTTHYAYDAANNLISVTDASGGETTYSYDVKNRLASFTDANGHSTTYAYDDNGNRIRKTDALSRSHTASYDLTGNLISATDAKNQTTTFSYDLLDRLTTITKPGNVTVNFTYDVNNNKLTTVDARGTTSRTYNALNVLTSVTTPDGKTVSYAYNANGQRSRLTYPDSRHADYAYDANGRLVSVTGPANDETSYTYRNDGSLASTTLPNGVVSSNTYDDAGRLSDITHVLGGTTLLAIDYTRDANGNPATIDDSRQGQSSYTFDELDQLISETRGSSTTSYTYDAVGNRLTKAVDGSTTTYAYDVANELTSAGAASYTYDANGSRATTAAGGQTTTYTFTSDNLLASIGSAAITTSYLYDGENQRVAATESGSTTTFVLDGDSVLQESTGSETTTCTYGLGLISRESSSGISYLLSDALGSVRLETDASGTVSTERAYDAFGAELGNPTMAGNRFRFTGQWSDGSGLTFLRARFYDPQTGTFLSVDPVPSAASQYAYCGNNPLLYVDPSGMSFWSSLAAVGKGFCNLVAGAADGIVGTFSWGHLNVGQPFGGPGMQTCYRVGQVGGTVAGFAIEGAAIAKACQYVGKAVQAYRAARGGAGAARFVVDSAGVATDLGSRLSLARPIVIGENMEGRVIPAARALGADWYQAPAGLNRAQSMAHNRYWVNEVMNEGRGVIDIGPASGRANFPEPTSDWFGMERDQIMQRGYSYYVQFLWD
jgi:RHS repeat-associated protein